MNYERIDITAKPTTKQHFIYSMNLNPNAKNYSNCDISGSFYEVIEKKVLTENKASTVSTASTAYTENNK